LRKGGLGDKGFKVEAHSFALLGTSFHGAADALQSRLSPEHSSAEGVTPGEDAQLTLVACVTGAWVTTAAEAAARLLAPWHAWKPQHLLETRLAWRPGQKLTLLELRVFHLEQPMVLRGEPGHGGCKSWIDGAAVQAAGSALKPALDDVQWAERQASLRAALAQLGDAVTYLDG
jgi:hypothetical protein